MLELLGVGKAHPTTVLDNFFFEELKIETSHDWIMERVGIETRRTVLPLDYIRNTRNVDPTEAPKAATISLAQLAAQAVDEAIMSAKITPQQIGLVIAGMCIPQVFIPANACLIASEAGIRAPSFDLNSACSTFSAQLHFINSMKKEALPDYVLLIQAETMTISLNFNDRNSAVLFGDAAAAQVLSPRKPGRAKIVKTSFNSDPSSWSKIITPPHGHFKQEGSAVQKFAIQRTVSTAQELLTEEQSLDPLYFIGHQANLRMLESSADRLGILPDHHFYNVNRYGNCGGAGAPTVLAERWDQFKSGDNVVIATVGAGLSWGGSLLQFRE